MNIENIMKDLNLIMLNIPNNLSSLEKVRWVYKKAGELFSYDYNYINDEESQVIYEKDYIGNYQTCIEISSILNLMLNNIDSNIKSEIVERNVDSRGRVDGHKCNVVSIGNEKYVLDLTLDLYLIQAGFQTKNFGYYTTIYGDEDIIPLADLEEMDKKLGLIKFGEYTDKKVNDAKSRINAPKNKNLSFEESVDLRISEMNKLLYKYNGFLEGKNLINKLLHDFMNYYYKDYYLTNENEMICCIQISNNEEEVWYLYSLSLGLIKTEKEKISQMLDSGWQTKSNSLDDELKESTLK